MSDEKYNELNELVLNDYKELKGRIEKLEKELSELKNHDIFRIWKSARKGGKATLQAILNLNQGIEEIREEHNYWEKEIVETIKIQEKNTEILREFGKEFVNLINDKIAHGTARLHETSAKENIEKQIKKLEGEKSDVSHVSSGIIEQTHGATDSKPEEPKEDTWILKKRDGTKEYYGASYFKLVRKEDLEYLQFIIENEGIYDDISPGDYKWLKNFRERYLNDE